MHWKCFFKHRIIQSRELRRLNVISDGQYTVEIIVAVLLFLFCFPLAFLLLRFTNLAHEFYINGICGRCERVWFDADKAEVTMGKAKVIMDKATQEDKKHLAKFERLAEMRRKAIR